MGLLTHLSNLRLYMFRREQFLAAHARRSGQCLQCGKCCDPLHLPFGIRMKCPWLDSKTRKCRIYNSRFRPIICRLSPTFETREEEERHKQLGCGFHPKRE